MSNVVLNRVSDALVIVDVQNDFCPGGTLPVDEGEVIIPVINDLCARFSHILLTQDWHPRDHRSFASQHPGAAPFDTTQMPYGQQTLWPDHCVQGTRGAEFHDRLDVSRAELVIRKGFRSDIDSYSAFFENDRKTPTGLTGYLKERGFTRLFFTGIATDVCVAYSALDSQAQGFDTVVVEDGCAAIDANGCLTQVRTQMETQGIALLPSAAIR
ncbi:MAG: bifunctional nicotinamidase/pyrazinamidase [Rhodospirillaceae bacterium]|nr:bifunctional nicotinamidase/pyrazinamidase [Rhodospirillaceae bacterium]